MPKLGALTFFFTSFGFSGVLGFGDSSAGATTVLAADGSGGGGDVGTESSARGSSEMWPRDEANGEKVVTKVADMSRLSDSSS